MSLIPLDAALGCGQAAATGEWYAAMAYTSRGVVEHRARRLGELVTPQG